jgi:glucosylglycerate phosphorylase
MSLKTYLKRLYPHNHQEIQSKIEALIQSVSHHSTYPDITEKDVMLITYGDSILNQKEAPLKTLKSFLDRYTHQAITNVHILPMFPYTSDDGFSVLDYLEIDPNLGTWEDIETLALDKGLMFDAVINHISKSSEWFTKYLDGEEAYQDFFIPIDKTLNYNDVVRPRALPLFYDYEGRAGKKTIWATFSDDQVDLNYQNPAVLLEILNILIQYALKGARFIRFDAVGFLWKVPGTPSIHLEETHLLVKIMREVLDQAVPGTKIITETNVPHKENISYFGDGSNEAHLVYQFPLPPLTLHSFVSEDVSELLNWAKSLDDTPLSETTTYFNFLASHDGIGMRPVEDLLSDSQKQRLVDHVLKNDGQIGYRTLKDGQQSPYELNINYMDAISQKTDSKDVRLNKFMASQALLLSFKGLPGIYIHSLLGSRNDLKGVETSKIKRRINREKLILSDLEATLNDPNSDRSYVLNHYLTLLNIRKNETAFDPYAIQEVLFLDSKVFSIIRINKTTNEQILVLINVSSQTVTLDIDFKGNDLIENQLINQKVSLNPYQYRWIKPIKEPS